jgi:hypothetical protein
MYQNVLKTLYYVKPIIEAKLKHKYFSQKSSENFCENEKSIKFDSDTACMVHVVKFF